SAGSYDQAVTDAEDALKLLPGDPAALALRKDAQSAKAAKAAEAAKRQEYDRLMARGRDALAAKLYDEAIQGADEALKLFPNDAAAKTLRRDGQAGKDGAATQNAKVKKPEWKRAVAVKVRKAGENTFDNARKVGIELYDDPNSNKLLFVSETGSLAVRP